MDIEDIVKVPYEIGFIGYIGQIMEDTFGMSSVDQVMGFMTLEICIYGDYGICLRELKNNN
ncbi:hypothetical protein KPL45_18045 [Clostridium estertheticum]|nr:hypothetical protein [Clostridium estertheticum]MBU3186719.1 hypothetical protein [Clostridium estertheticum]